MTDDVCITLEFPLWDVGRLRQLISGRMTSILNRRHLANAPLLNAVSCAAQRRVLRDAGTERIQQGHEVLTGWRI